MLDSYKFFILGQFKFIGKLRALGVPACPSLHSLKVTIRNIFNVPIFYTITAHLSKLSKLQTLFEFHQFSPLMFFTFSRSKLKITLRLDDYFFDLTSHKGFVKSSENLSILYLICVIGIFSSSNYFFINSSKSLFQHLVPLFL